MKPKIPKLPAHSRFFIPSRIALVAMALGAASITATLPAAHAQVDVSVSADVDAGGNSYRLFYDKLGDQGDWIQTEQYGYVFQPRVVTTNHKWRPYTDGYWAQTDSGWTWVSNEDHGWATYHYGRWANVVDTGWVWVPGGEWSPGNVSWRVSRDHKHVGWAPLPPEARLHRGEDIEGWVDTAYDIGPESYTFIETNHFGENTYVSHVVPVEQNVTIITETENVTRVSYRTVQSREVVYCGGPEVTIINESVGRPVRHFDLELQPRDTGYFEHEDYRNINAVNGNRLVVATATREVITSNTIRVSEPAHVTRRLNAVTVDRGYRGLGDAQAIERVRTQLRAQSPTPPPQVEQRASAALRKNGTNVPPPAPVTAAGAPGAPDKKPGNVPPGVPPATAAVPSPAAVDPTAHTPGHKPGVPAPGAPNTKPPTPPVAGKPGEEPQLPKPAATPAEGKPAASPVGNKPHQGQPAPGTAATPAIDNGKKDHENTALDAHATPAAGHPEGPASATPPKAHVNHPEAGEITPPAPKPDAEHPRQPGTAAHPEATPATTADEHRDKPAPAAAPHHPTEPAAHEQRAKPEEPKAEARQKPESQAKPEPKAPERPAHPAAPEPAEHREPAQHKEPAAEKAPAEKKPAAPKPEAAPAHRAPEEHAPAAKPEHKEEKPAAEEKKSSPKP